MATYPDRADFSTFVSPSGLPDLDPSWTPIEGPRTVLEHCARRLITTPGQYDDPEWGFDISTYLNAALLNSEFAGLVAAVKNEVLQVEGVDTVDVTVVDPSEAGVLTLTVSVTLLDQDGDFYFVFELGSDTLPRIYFPV